MLSSKWDGLGFFPQGPTEKKPLLRCCKSREDLQATSTELPFRLSMKGDGGALVYFSAEQGQGSHTKPVGWGTAAWKEGTQERIMVRQGSSVSPL